ILFIQILVVGHRQPLQLLPLQANSSSAKKLTISPVFFFRFQGFLDSDLLYSYVIPWPNIRRFLFQEFTWSELISRILEYWESRVEVQKLWQNFPVCIRDR
ncbi:hypothetical protein F2P56_025411, partial [Juglans regia]